MVGRDKQSGAESEMGMDYKLFNSVLYENSYRWRQAHTILCSRASSGVLQNAGDVHMPCYGVYPAGMRMFLFAVACPSALWLTVVYISSEVNMNEPLAAFRRTFRRAHATANRLLREQLPRDDSFLRELMLSTLRGQETADYAFVFENAFCRRDSDVSRVGRMAGAVHLLQSSAFVTDDIFDHSDLRYGHAAVHKEYGASYAIIAAELMQSAALRTISVELQLHGFPNALAVMEILNRVVLDLYVGQYLDVRHTRNLRMTRQRYNRVIALGVGFYFANLARCGALLAGKTAAEVRSLTSFGYHYGMALFISDDIVDVLDTSADTGKSSGRDLVNRRMRLPIMLALRMANSRDARLLRRFMTETSTSRGKVREAVRVIQRSGALEGCKKAAQHHVTQSISALRRLSLTLPVQRLEWLSRTLLRTQGIGQL